MSNCARCSTPLRAGDQAPGFGTLCPRCVLADAAHERPPETPDSDALFGKLVVEQGLAKPEHVRECLGILGSLAERAVRPMPKLGEILMRKGYLTLDQFNRTMKAAGGTTIQYAPSGTPKAAVPDEVREAAADPVNRLGKYLRVSKFGAGGMGEVWKAWDTELGRWVALKFLKGEDVEDVARFSREAQTAAKLNHPNIGAVYEVGERQGKHFIAMQFVAGQTLETFPRDDRGLLAELIRDAAIAVHAAHEGGVIHRDLKPSNIMVEGKPGPRKKTTRRAPGQSRASGLRVYVMDFGLAKPMQVDSKLSRSGVIVGTPAYMSPEQARGKMHEVGAGSDVYSLGATLYELLTDRPLFREKDVYELLRRVVEEEPKAVRKVNPRIDADLETIVMKCIEKDPARRYASALELAEDLTRYLGGEAIEAHPPSAAYRARKWMGRRKALVAAGTLAGMALLVGAGFGASQLVKARAARRGEARQEDLTRKAEREKAAEREGREKAEREKAALAVYEEGKRDLHALRLRTYRATWRLTKDELQEYEDLIGRCRAQMEKTGASAHGWWVIGRARHALGDWAGAIGGYEEGLKAQPGYGPCLLYKARVLIERALVERFTQRQHGAGEKMREATALLGEGIASAGIEPIELDLARGYELVVKGRSAAEYCAKMLEKWKGADFAEEFHLIRGLADWDRLIEDATKALEARPAFSEAYVWRGVAHQNKGNLPGAIEDYTKAIEINPRDTEVYYWRGRARESKGDRDGAIADYSKAIEINPRLAEVYFRRGFARQSKGDKLALSERLEEARVEWARAIEDYTKAIEINPRDAMAYYSRGRARESKGDRDGAIEDYTKANELDPREAAAHNNRGVARQAKGDVAGAIEDYTKAIEIDPRYAEAYYNRGIARESKGDRDGAIADYAKAIEIDPWYVKAYYNRGLARQAKGDTGGAIADFEKALEVAPPNWRHRANVQDALEGLKRRRQ